MTAHDPKQSRPRDEEQRMSIDPKPVDLGALRGLVALMESAVEDERRYTLRDGSPTYDDVRSVRMIVRDKQMAKCAGMIGPLLEVYEAACTARDKAAAFKDVKEHIGDDELVPVWIEHCKSAEAEWLEAYSAEVDAVDRARSPR